MISTTYQKPLEMINKIDFETHKTNFLNYRILTIDFQYN